tara:strand:+ start:1343 stop:1513 length:171 start_codon:yes stop_codon:yes gene_type:complete
MKDLNNIENQDLKETAITISKILIKVMTYFGLENFIETTSIYDGYRYKLRFDKEKI